MIFFKGKSIEDLEEEGHIYTQKFGSTAVRKQAC